MRWKKQLSISGVSFATNFIVILHRSTAFSTSHAQNPGICYATPIGKPCARKFMVKTSRRIDPLKSLESGEKEMSRSQQSSPSTALLKLNFGEFEIRERREMEWLIRTTSQILGKDAPPVGSLSPEIIRKANAVMRAWMRRSSKPGSNAAHVVERLLERFVDEREAGNYNVVTTTVMYNLLIESWASTKNEPGSAQRAHDILRKMEEMHSLGHSDVKPDTQSYSFVLKAWARSREPDALERMEGILRKMEEIAEKEPGGNVHPTVRCYNLYLYVLANSSSPNIAGKADELLMKMKNSHAAGNLDLPDVNTYNQVISALAKIKNEMGAIRAEEIFDEMMANCNITKIHPNTDTFNALMGCWLKSGHERASYHIENILELMNEKYQAGVCEARPDHYSINTALSAISKSGTKYSVRKAHSLLMRMEEIYGVKPNTRSYNIVINAHAKSRDVRSGDKAEKLLESMEKMYMEGHDVMPDSFSFTSVIDAISMKNDAGKKAEAIVQRMESLSRHGGCRPNTAVYNAMLNAWTIRGDKHTIRRSQKILKFMEDCYESGQIELKPNTRSYNTILKAFSRGKENYSRQAEDLLVRMENMYAEGNSDIIPDIISYTSVISTYAKSNEREKARSAQRLLYRTIESYKNGNQSAKPNTYVFNACLNACAHTYNQADKIDAFLVLVETLLLLQEYTQPDHITFGTFLRACSNLIPKDDERRQRVVSSVFKHCCKEGQVGTMVMQQLRFSASPELYKALVGNYIDEEVSLSKIPPQWSRNVRVGRK